MQILLSIINMLVIESTDVLSIRNVMIVITYRYKHDNYVPNWKFLEFVRQYAQYNTLLPPSPWQIF